MAGGALDRAETGNEGGGSIPAGPGARVMLASSGEIMVNQGGTNTGTTTTVIDTSSVTQRQAQSTETTHTAYWMTSLFEGGTLNGYWVIDGVFHGPQGSESERSIPAMPPSTRTVLGSNAYMEWGYWASTALISLPSPHYENGRTYYEGGVTTPDSQIATLTASGVVGNYTGTAYGGHLQFGSPTITPMQGTFSATINFATSAVTNFNINVSGGGQSALITGASGTLGNSAAGPGVFSVSGGTVSVSGSTSISNWNSGGTIFGNNGQAVGVDWWMHGNHSRTGGIYQGTR